MTVWVVAVLFVLVGSGLLMVYLLSRRVPWRIAVLLPTAVLAVLSVLLLRALDASTVSTLVITSLVTVVYYAGMMMVWLLVGDQFTRMFNARW